MRLATMIQITLRNTAYSKKAAPETTDQGAVDISQQQNPKTCEQNSSKGSIQAII